MAKALNKTIREPARDIKVCREVDVVVVGRKAEGEKNTGFTPLVSNKALHLWLND